MIDIMCMFAWECIVSPRTTLRAFPTKLIAEHITWGLVIWGYGEQMASNLKYLATYSSLQGFLSSQTCNNLGKLTISPIRTKEKKVNAHMFCRRNLPAPSTYCFFPFKNPQVPSKKLWFGGCWCSPQLQAFPCSLTGMTCRRHP